MIRELKLEVERLRSMLRLEQGETVTGELFLLKNIIQNDNCELT